MQRQIDLGEGLRPSLIVLWRLTPLIVHSALLVGNICFVQTSRNVFGFSFAEMLIIEKSEKTPFRQSGTDQLLRKNCCGNCSVAIVCRRCRLKFDGNEFYLYVGGGVCEYQAVFEFYFYCIVFTGDCNVAGTNVGRNFAVFSCYCNRCGFVKS